MLSKRLPIYQNLLILPMPSSNVNQSKPLRILYLEHQKVNVSMPINTTILIYHLQSSHYLLATLWILFALHTIQPYSFTYQSTSRLPKNNPSILSYPPFIEE